MRMFRSLRMRIWMGEDPYVALSTLVVLKNLGKDASTQISSMSLSFSILTMLCLGMDLSVFSILQRV